jgi:glutamyl/glutaminyl-tRNA synthetase
MVKLADAVPLLDYLWTDPEPPAIEPDSTDRIKAAMAAIQDVPWEPEPIHEALTRVADESGVSRNKVFMPIRLALTGKKISLPIDYTLALLPKDVAMQRLRRVAG